MFKLTVNQKYLWFPVQNGGEKKEISVLCDGRKIYEFDIEICGESWDFYAYWNVEAYLGQTLTFEGEGCDEWFAKLRNEPSIPQDSDERKRPLIHFTPYKGWLNDPNGLVYHNGVYHMYFQHNPYGINWGNMHWGHAQSTDLFHWTELGDVLYPDENGVMYSGSAFVDSKNDAGFGKDTILYFYTADSVQQSWSADKNTTQRMAYSVDGGKTLIKTERGVVPFVIEENRDPKVFWHEESGAYIMALYLAGNDFAIYRSQNLTDWKQTQVLTLDKAWECPDIFQLSVDGDPNNKRWVFWSADGFCFPGTFDGYRFTPDGECLVSSSTKLPYAAQTYSNISDRVISESWLRTTNHGNAHTSLMGIPVELGLKTTTDGLRVTSRPVKEMLAIRKAETSFTQATNQVLAQVEETAQEILCTFAPSQTGAANLQLLDAKLDIDFAAGTVRFGKESFHFDNKEALSLRIYVDYDVVEIFAQDDTVYFPCEYDFETLTGTISLTASEGNCAEQVTVYALQSNR